ncbi:MAG: hypothetical protein Q8J64_09085 [Thermodesulfovibrionales bacterium]|nr:hypothetical protein [Thermodesulfovibrionales bacterium]
MTKMTTVDYECRLCGTRVVITSTGEHRLEPVYCCGMEVHEITALNAAKTKKPAKAKTKKPAKAAKKPDRVKKPAAKKPAKGTAKKKTAKKK